MDVLVALIVLALVAVAIWLFLTAHGHRHEEREFTVASWTTQDGTLVVAIRGRGSEQIVRELPPSLGGEDMHRALRLARVDAQRRADALNREAAARRKGA